MEQLKKAFADTCGVEMPEEQKKFWKEFTDIINGAYDAGVLAGIRKMRKPAFNV